MIKKRNKFWTVIFALLPGAGHMYNGFMKLGVSLMGLFFAVWAFATFVSVGAIGLLTPIIWFYAFFDCINRTFVDEEEFYAQEDKYLFNMELADSTAWRIVKTHSTLIGVALVLIGIFALWNNIFIGLFSHVFTLPSAVVNLFYAIEYLIPQVIVAILIIWAGVLLIRGKKRELDKKEGELAEK